MTEQLEAWPAGQTATMNVTYTQANAAGGAVVCEISPEAGNEFMVMTARATNSGTNGLVMQLRTGVAGTEILRFVSIASAAGTNGAYPQYTAAGTASGILAGSPQPGLIVSGTQAFAVIQTGAGAQNDTFQVLVNIRLKTGQIPIVTHANSTNPANVSVTSGAESFTVV